MTTIAFFNNKGGVGKTTLVYHLAWMFSELDVPVVVADLDPQANASTMFLAEERLEELWREGDHPDTILGGVSPILRGTGDILATPHVEEVAPGLGLLVGDLGLSRFEDNLSSAWPQCLDHNEAAFRTVSGFHRLIANAARGRAAHVALIDVGPNLGAINRAALLAADFVVIPLGPDVVALQALRSMGPTLGSWRKGWRRRVREAPGVIDSDLPSGRMEPAGYIVLEHGVRIGGRAAAYEWWGGRIPGVYRTEMLEQADGGASGDEEDEHCLATLKHYRSLMAMAQEARKPMFHLRSADGALGAHTYAVLDCRADFEALARKLATRCGIEV